MSFHSPSHPCEQYRLSSVSPVGGARSRKGRLFAGLGNSEILRNLVKEADSFFSTTSVPVSVSDIIRVRSIVSAFWRLFTLPAYLEEVEGITGHRFGGSPFDGLGIFGSFDFHMSGSGPRVIEINTNAGGGILQDVCGRGDHGVLEFCGTPRLDRPIYVANLFEEWRRQGGVGPLRTLAIIDDVPESQFLYPEMLMFGEQCRLSGLKVVICSPQDLVVTSSGVWADNDRIDFIYNRHTDFGAWSDHMVGIWRSATAGKVVVSPNPDHYFRYADKRLLTLFSDLERLRSFGLSSGDCHEIGKAVPKTRILARHNSEDVWSRRRQSFFKPKNGYGSKAVYDGRKISRRKYDSILDGGYVVQDRVDPTRVRDDVTGREFKYDLRCFTYGSAISAAVPRLYRGQVTNFRTEGGGFGRIQLYNDRVSGFVSH